MKEFVKDYGKVLSTTWDFYKNHWKGVIVMNVALSTVTLLHKNKEMIWDKINEKARERTLRKEAEETFINEA